MPAPEQSKLTQRYLEEFDRYVGEDEPSVDPRRAAGAHLKRGTK